MGLLSRSLALTSDFDAGPHLTGRQSMTFGSTRTPGAQPEWLGHPPLPRQRCLENGDHPPRSPFSNSGAVWRSGGIFRPLWDLRPCRALRGQAHTGCNPQQGVTGTAWQGGGAGGPNNARGTSAPARALRLRPVTTASARSRQPQLMPADKEPRPPGAGTAALERRCRCTPNFSMPPWDSAGPSRCVRRSAARSMRCGAAAVSSTRTRRPAPIPCRPRGPRPRDRVRRRAARVSRGHGDRDGPEPLRTAPVGTGPAGTRTCESAGSPPPRPRSPPVRSGAGGLAP